MNDTFQDALLVVASVRAALKNGVKHYNLDNKLLTKEIEIIETLRNGGKILFDETERVEVTTTLKEFEEFWK